MSEYPQYHIESLKDFLKVPVERREACMAEFIMWLAMVDLWDVVADTIPEPIPYEAAFTWIDDGKNNVEINVSVKGRGNA